jgi:hypothetical protein
VTGENRYIFGRESYSVKAVCLVTFVTALPPVIGFWGTFDIAGGIFASAYLAVCLFWYIVVQPKVVCTSCAYYNGVCARGLGKIAALLYRPTVDQDGGGPKLAVIFWRYWYAAVPACGFIYLLIFRFSWMTVIFCGAFVTTAVLAYLVTRNYCCADCQARNSCFRSPFREKK